MAGAAASEREGERERRGCCSNSHGRCQPMQEKGVGCTHGLRDLAPPWSVVSSSITSVVCVAKEPVA